MGNHKSLEQINVGELAVIRHGWFRPWYELGDGEFSYGSVTYTGFFRQYAILETLEKSWTIKRKGNFSRTLVISDTRTGEPMGEFKPERPRRISVTLNNGNFASFAGKKIFSRIFTVATATDGDIIIIKPKFRNFKTPLTVSFDPLTFRKIPDMPLLLLSGVYLALLRQQQAVLIGH